MDHKQFQECLSGIDHLSPAQRQQTEAVFLGAPVSIGIQK